MSAPRLSEELLDRAVEIRVFFQQAELHDAAVALARIDEEGDQDDLELLREAMDAAECVLTDVQQAADDLRDLIAAGLKEREAATP